MSESVVDRVWEQLLAAMGSEGCRADAPIAVTFADLYALIQLAEATPRDAADAGGGWTCNECGHDTGLEAWVADEVWSAVSPTGGRGGALCLWCIDRLATERGIKGPVRVRLTFRGRVLDSDPSTRPEATA